MDEQKIRTLFRDYKRNRILYRLAIREIGSLDIVIGDYSFQRDKKKIYYLIYSASLLNRSHL